MENAEIESKLVEGEDSFLMLASNIREMLETVGPPVSSECCIYRVHNTLRNLNKAAYTPKLVSIGPFHYGKVELETMERYKVVCLRNILGTDGVNRSLEESLIYIKQQEQTVRDCYAESIELSSDEFVKMILLDASFILTFFLRLSFEHEEDEFYYVISRAWMIVCIKYDLRLLENQLPFFVLEGLYDLFFPSNRYNHMPSFFSLVRRRFHFNNQEISPGQVQDIKHFTDFIRTFMLPSSPRLEPKPGKSGQLSYSAVELHQAGVKFEVSPQGKRLLDIEFSNGVLQIPYLMFVDSTESSLRNLMALEQCHYPNDTYICDYVVLMDELINTGKDVDLLVQNGIISNHLGHNDALATIINNLGIEIVRNFGKSYFSKLCQDLNEYYKNPWHTWKATLKRDYFSTPWRIVSTVAAIMLLGLTLIQTVKSFVP